jgi:hypothetical protein
VGTHLGAQPGARDADISLDLLPRAVSSASEGERRVEHTQVHSGALVADLIIDLERLQKKAAARAAARTARSPRHNRERRECMHAARVRRAQVRARAPYWSPGGVGS